MAKQENPMVTSGEVLGSWVKDLRTELKQVREQAARNGGIEPLKVRLEALEVEGKLVETVLSFLSKTIEVMGKSAT